MIKNKLTKKLITFMAVFILSPIPNVALAESLISQHNQMISSSAVLAEVTRSQAESDIRDYLQKTDVQTELLKQGLSSDEVSLRLASLSESEIRQLSTQIKEARAGGDILFTILIVVLIIYLIKRL